MQAQATRDEWPLGGFSTWPPRKPGKPLCTTASQAKATSSTSRALDGRQPQLASLPPSPAPTSCVADKEPLDQKAALTGPRKCLAGFLGQGSSQRIFARRPWQCHSASSPRPSSSDVGSIASSWRCPTQHPWLHSCQSFAELLDVFKIVMPTSCTSLRGSLLRVGGCFALAAGMHA